MAYLFDPGSILGLVSGLIVLAFGIMAAAVRPASVATVSAAALGVVWGLGVIFANLANLAADVSTCAPWVYASVACYLLVYGPVLWLTFAAGRQLDRRRMLILILATLPAVLALLLYLARPDLFVRGIVMGGLGYPETVTGPLYFPAILASGSLAFFVALAVASQRLRSADSLVNRTRLTWMCIGLGLFTSSLTAGALAMLRDPTAEGMIGLVALALTAAAGLGAIVLAHAAKRSSTEPEVLTAALIVPLAIGAIEIGLLEAGVLGFDTVGLWRIGLVAALSYAVGIGRVADLQARVRAAAPRLAQAACALFLLFALWSSLSERLARSPTFAVVASVGVVLASAPAGLLGRRLASGRDPDEVDHAVAALCEVTDKRREMAAGSMSDRLGLGPDGGAALLRRVDAERALAPLARRYRVVRELGQGTFGRALLARDRLLDRNVVLKQPFNTAPENVEAVVREARLGARILHPHVIVVHEVVEGNPPCIVLEYAPGGSLQDRLRGRECWEEGEAARVLLDALDGVAAIHFAGLLHRDLKPANILFAADGRAKIADLGLSTDLAGRTAALGSSDGTIAFASPEQALGAPLGPTSDLYSLGAILHRLLSGEHYLDLAGRHPLEAAQLVAYAPPRAIEGRLAIVVQQALAKDPAARYPSAAAMAQAIRSALARSPDKDDMLQRPT